MGVFVLLQYAVGMVSAVCAVRGVREYDGCFCYGGEARDQEENQMMCIGLIPKNVKAIHKIIQYLPIRIPMTYPP